MSNNNETISSLVPVDGIKPASLELEAVRSQLAAAKGPKYWRTLEELSGAFAARISARGFGVG
jgi:hypothetical protein